MVHEQQITIGLQNKIITSAAKHVAAHEAKDRANLDKSNEIFEQANASVEEKIKKLDNKMLALR